MNLKELELKRLKAKGYDISHLKGIDYDVLLVIASALDEGIDLEDTP